LLFFDVKLVERLSGKEGACDSYTEQRVLG